MNPEPLPCGCEVTLATADAPGRVVMCDEHTDTGPPITEGETYGNPEIDLAKYLRLLRADLDARGHYDA
jgi:hypothetical protein